MLAATMFTHEQPLGPAPGRIDGDRFPGVRDPFDDAGSEMPATVDA